MSGSALLGRRAAITDLPSLITIMEANPAAPAWTPAQMEAMLKPMPDENVVLRRAVLVVEREGAVAGFAVVSVLDAGSPIEAELESIAVLPAEKRQGIGRALLGCVMGWAAKAGANRMRLEVRESNAAALALYRQGGFIQTGIRHGYYAAPTEDALLMERSLRST